MVLICIAVLGRVFYIQQVQGNYWRGLSDSLHQKYVDLSAERGTIYSEDGNMLSTSVPYFNIYIDFAADGLREKNGKRLRKIWTHFRSALPIFSKTNQPPPIKRNYSRDIKAEDRYYLLQKNLSFDQYKQLRDFPLGKAGQK